jgi:hypothetical protein
MDSIDISGILVGDFYTFIDLLVMLTIYIDLGVNNINLVQQRKMEWTSSMLYLLSSNLTKLSLLWFYRRIFTTEPIRRILLCVTIFVIGYFVTFIGVLLFECRPLNFYWTSSATPTPNGTCADEASIHLVSGILNVIIDATILVLPLQAVFNLKINRRQKIQVASIFLAGILVVVSSTFRIVETAQTLRSYDVTWYGNLTWLWICIEVDVGLICASVPACRSLLSVWSEKLTTMQSLGSRNAPNSARDNASANTSTSRIQSRSSYAKMDTEKLGRKDNPANWNGAWKEEGMSKPSPVRLEKDEEHNLEFLGDPGGLAKELGKDKGDTASVRSMGVFYYH